MHSKLLIVDDKWITVGSANTDKNGFKDSTEVNIGITSSSLAKELRISLWCEHVGMLEKPEISTTRDLRKAAKKLRTCRHQDENLSHCQTLTTLVLRTLVDLTSGRR